MTEMEIERILWSWPRVVATARGDWAKGFTASIGKQMRRPGWQPTEKQAGIMRRMVAELYSAPGEDFDVVLSD